MKLPQTTPRS